jgi:DNA polymerase III alpha subunit
MYVELHAASAFSFLQGASLPETLVERAAALGYSAIALLDADGVYGAPRFYKAAARAGLRAIVGAELTIEASAFGVHQAGGQVGRWAGRSDKSLPHHQGQHTRPSCGSSFDCGSLRIA